MKHFYALSLTVLLFACACSSSAGEYVHQPVAQKPSSQEITPVNFARDTADTLLRTLTAGNMPDTQSPHANAFSPAAYLQYGRGFLSGEQQRLYDDLFEAAVNWQVPFSLAVPDTLSDSEAHEVITGLLYDNPQLYWVQPLLEHDSQNGMRSLELSLVSGLTLEEVQTRNREIAEAAAALLEQLSGSRAQQLYQIHDYLAEHLYYEGDPAYADSANIYGGLVNRRVTCDGYAKTFQYLMHQINLDCVYIHGNSPGGSSHAWNAVHLEDGWYYVDVTWDVNKSARTQVFHDYCATTLEEMALEHIWAPAQYPTLPPSNGTAYNYYIQSAYALSPDLSQSLTPQLASTFTNQLKDRQIPDNWQPVFLEIKILSDIDTYERVKAHFISEIYPLLETMQLEATASGLPFAIRTGETITCNFNDTLQILNLYPVVQAD